MEFDILRPGVWFGPTDQADDDRLDANAGVGTLRSLGAGMKRGDFSRRGRLLELIVCSSDDYALRQQAIRLFCFTCRHEDVAQLGELLDRFDHDDVLSIVSAMPDTLSPESIPYLFALLASDEGPALHDYVYSAIERILPWGYSGEAVDNIKLAERFSGFATKLIPSAYYYGGSPAHPGILCKSLIERSALAASNRQSFGLANAPTLLSVWSGIKCPVNYGDVMDDEKVQSVFSYVSTLAAMPWLSGRKYFYGHEIV